MPRSRTAFTLIELLVVVAIIAVLVSVLLPALGHARRSGMRAKCLSNMRQIGAAVLMYQHDHAGAYAVTMETTSLDVPVTVSWWAVQNYQNALNPYIRMERGGVDESGNSRGKGNNVWFDPADPDADTPAMWGSFINNGYLTGAPCKDSLVPRPADTVYATLREQNWSRATGVPVPDPLPVLSQDDPFWSSVYFDMCLDPWAVTGDPNHPYHWRGGRATPPRSLFPSEPEPGIWDEVIDGRSPLVERTKPRYGRVQCYLFCDGHADVMRFEETYQGAGGNMWDLK